jgi:hypothetical protein
LGKNGSNSYFSWINIYSEPSHGFYPEFDKAEDLGSPTGGCYYYQGVLTRDFENGKVLVNSANHGCTVDLERKYQTLYGEVLTIITMESHEGILLMKVND